MKNPHTLICSAVESEISELKKLPEAYKAIPIGIGLVESALGLSKILHENRSLKNIIFIGTCGSYPNSSLNIFDLVQSHHHQLIGSASILGTAYFPENMQKSLLINKAIDSNLREVKSATVHEITQSDDLARKIEKIKSVDIEHMEIFSVASVSQKYKLNCSAFFAVSNIVGANSHKEWLENRVQAEKSIQELLISYILI